MKRFFLFITTLGLLAGCIGPGQDASQTAHVIKDVSWYVPLITTYINQTDNERIRLAVKDNLNEKWIFDRVENTDTAKYFICGIL